MFTFQHKSLKAPVPCLKCTQPRYCSETCRKDSWNSYHRFECGGLDVLHSVGIAHLGMRIILVTGLPKLLKFQSAINKGESFDDSYSHVLGLVDHIPDLSEEDLFHYTLTAVLLGLYLDQRTKFFTSCPTSASAASELDNLSLGHHNQLAKTSSVDEDVFLFVCGLILRHITQLVCNGHAIYEVGPVDTSLEDVEAGPVVSNNQYRLATAIYPAASMMNHSCDPTVINSFHNRRLIVRAIKPVTSGGEVFNCYGPHFRRHSLPERQEMLRGQYHFTCDCSSCKRKDLIEFQERFSALRCHYCGGPIQNPQSEANLAHSMPCLDCGRKNVNKPNVSMLQTLTNALLFSLTLIESSKCFSRTTCTRRGWRPCSWG